MPQTALYVNPEAVDKFIRDLQSCTAQGGALFASAGGYARDRMSRATSSDAETFANSGNVGKLWSAIEPETFERLSIDAGMFLVDLSAGGSKARHAKLILAICQRTRKLDKWVIDGGSLEQEITDRCAPWEEEDVADSVARDMLSGLHDLRTISKIMKTINLEEVQQPDLHKALTDIRNISWFPSTETDQALSQKMEEMFDQAGTSLAQLALEVKQECILGLAGQYLSLGVWSDWDRKRALFVTACSALKEGRGFEWFRKIPRHMPLCRPTLRGDKSYIDAMIQDKQELLADSQADPHALQARWERMHEIYRTHAEDVYKPMLSNPNDQDDDRRTCLERVLTDYNRASEIMQNCMKSISLESTDSTDLKGLGIEVGQEPTWEEIRSAWAATVHADTEGRVDEAEEESEDPERTPTVAPGLKFFQDPDVAMDERDARRILDEIRKSRFTSRKDIKFRFDESEEDP